MATDIKQELSHVTADQMDRVMERATESIEKNGSQAADLSVDSSV